MKYSKKTGGFYSAEIHGKNIPDDVVEITKSYHAELLNGQSQGKIIKADKDGFPISEDRPPASKKELERYIRDERNRRVLAAADMTAKYEREQASVIRGIEIPDPMTEADYIIALQYLQYLFELPQQEGFPWGGVEDPLCPWPTEPDYVIDSTDD